MKIGFKHRGNSRPLVGIGVLYRAVSLPGRCFSGSRMVYGEYIVKEFINVEGDGDSVCYTHGVDFVKTDEDAIHFVRSGERYVEKTRYFSSEGYVSDSKVNIEGVIELLKKSGKPIVKEASVMLNSLCYYTILLTLLRSAQDVRVYLEKKKKKRVKPLTALEIFSEGGGE